jgi:ABC-type glutathione transport system ATPase component
LQSFDFVVQSDISESFRVKSVIDKFDLQMEKLEHRFIGKIEMPETWNIGAIVGTSGTGKTTIAKQLFGYTEKQQQNDAVVIDLFDKTVETKKITATLNAVGFSSPPSWLKKYSVLSVGEQMRVRLAQALLEQNDPIVFDEYSSVVDRDVAQITSIAISKTIRRDNKRFIAVSCHYDIIPWLNPDWCFDCASMKNIELQKKNQGSSFLCSKQKQNYGVFLENIII